MQPIGCTYAVADKLELMIAEAKAEAAASWAVAQAEVDAEAASGIFRNPATIQQAISEAARRGFSGAHAGMISMFYAYDKAGNIVCL